MGIPWHNEYGNRQRTEYSEQSKLNLVHGHEQNPPWGLKGFACPRGSGLLHHKCLMLA